MEGSTKASADQIEQELEQLLDQELFEPPAEFREHALISDESVYEEAAKDPRGATGRSSRRSCSTGRSRGTPCSTSPRRPSTSGSSAAS